MIENCDRNEIWKNSLAHYFFTEKWLICEKEVEFYLIKLAELVENIFKNTLLKVENKIESKFVSLIFFMEINCLNFNI